MLLGLSMQVCKALYRGTKKNLYKTLIILGACLWRLSQDSQTIRCCRSWSFREESALQDFWRCSRIWRLPHLNEPQAVWASFTEILDLVVKRVSWQSLHLKPSKTILNIYKSYLKFCLFLIANWFSQCWDLLICWSIVYLEWRIFVMIERKSGTNGEKSAPLLLYHTAFAEFLCLQGWLPIR